MVNVLRLNGAAIVATAAVFVFSQPLTAKEDTPLGESMEQSSKALKSLRSIKKDDWEAGAKAARMAADALRKGMAFEPILLKDIKDPKEKAKALADYKRVMGVAYSALCELELAYLSEDQAKVDAAMKKVKAAKKEGHKKYEDD